MIRLTVHLQRVGASRVSYEAIPLQARVLQGSKVGENLLPGRWTDVDGAKAEVRRLLEQKLGRVEVEWVEVGLKGSGD